MNSKRPWIIAGVTTFALAGFGAAAAVASDDGGSQVRDPHPAPVVQKYDAPLPQNGAFDNSPETADSPAASVVDSADPALDTADSPDDKIAAPAAPAVKVNKEAKVTKVAKVQAPKKKAPADSADSGDSAD
ncbi:hypothetical protein DMH04_40445 [Kibdelosporangium aridum]|uniref:Uncharacterized protein n=1 Tax=Kibdelosporangium aridum TaxID=2030 RepID=A0A428YVN2_KIBAR|nr:hypothetical protein [Kibdelosporangium aridum]RSM73835.1 hypothetical protein DMH04_40445 [Kibdelosporangium aridum]